MSTRGTAVFLSKKKAEAVWVRYGGDFCSKLVYGNIQPNQIKAMIELAKQREKEEGDENHILYREFTDERDLAKLNSYDEEPIIREKFDSEITVFLKIEFEGDDEKDYDMVIKRTVYEFAEDDTKIDLVYMG